MTLGSIVVRLSMDTATFDTDAGRAAKIADKRAKEIDASFKKAGVAIGVALAAAAIGIGKLTKDAIDNADALRDSSIQLGVSTETLSAYAYAASQTGTDIESLNTGLKILAKNAADALKPTSEQAKIFDALGISVADSEGKLRQLDSLIPEIATAFKGMEDGTTKAALAQALFGKSGLELVQFLNQGADGLEAFTRRAEELGIIVSTDAANAADELNDKLGDLKAIASGLGLELAENLLPSLIRFANRVEESSKKGGILRFVMDDISKSADSMTKFMDQSAKDVDNLANRWVVLGFAANAANNLMRGNFAEAGKQWDMGQALLERGPQRTSAGSSRRGGGPMNMTPGVSAVDEAAMQRALAGISAPPRGRAGGGGKSDAAKEADQLTASYERMVAQLKEQAAMVGVVSDVEKLRYELNSGEMSKLSEGQKSELLNLAQIAEFRKEDYENLLEAIRVEEDRRRGYERDLGFAKQTQADLLFEIDLLGKSRDEQERLTLARQLGAAAATEQGEAALKALKDYQDAAKANSDAIDAMDALRDSTRGFFSDLREGVGIWDTLKNALGDFADALFDLVAQNLVDQLFGQNGTSGGGTFGDALGEFFGSFFGGGKASGGWAAPNKLYQVNERGFEMATVGGSDYMLTGSQPVQITPNHMLGRSPNGPPTINQVINVQGMMDRRTPGQIAQQSGREISRAMRRNG